MESLLKDDYLALPLIFQTPDLSKQFNVINCNGWQFEVGKDQPMVILQNQDPSLQNLTECPYLLTTNPPFEETNEDAVDCSKAEPGKLELTEEKQAEPCSENNQICKEEPEQQIKFESNIVEDLVETHLEVFVTYKCRLCPFTTTVKETFSQHLENVHANVPIPIKIEAKEEEEEKVEESNTTDEQNLIEDVKAGNMVYMCGNCTEAFTSFSECRIHMASVHKIMMGSNMALEGADLKDDIDYITREEITGNIKVVKKEKKKTLCDKKPKYVCSVRGCLVKLNSKESIEKHKNCHVQVSPRMFSCTTCNEVFRQWSLCANHLWKMHQEDIDLFSCSTCEYKTAFREKLHQHEKIHKDGKDFMCSVCGKNFKQKTQLRNHQVLHLRGSGEQLPNWVKRRGCDQCNKTFCDAKALKKHVQAVHSKLRPYVCQVCGHCSATKGMLQTHLRQHSGEKPFTCNVCNFSTGDHNTLRRHLMRHSGRKPYQCQHCSYSAIQSSALKAHLANKHPGKAGMFSCTRCSFSTVSLNSFLHHTHVNEKANQKPKEEDSTQLIYIPYNKQKNSDSSASTTIEANGEFIAVNLAEVLMADDDESNHFFESDTIDIGGITIPAEPSIMSDDKHDGQSMINPGAIISGIEVQNGFFGSNVINLNSTV